MYYLVIAFTSLEELKQKLRQLLDQLEGKIQERRQVPTSQVSVRLLCDETVKKIGPLVKRLCRDHGINVEIYEVDSSLDREVTIEDVTYVPAKDDLDVLKVCKQLNAILVTGDKKLARTASAYGMRVIYIPPSNVLSKEDYAMRIIERVKQLLSGQEVERQEIAT